MTPGDLVAGRFEIVEPAGRGGMCTVYRAYDRENDHELVAVKVLHQASPSNAATLLREGELLAAVSHPNVVGHRAHGELPDGRAFLVMEWVTGESLAARVKNRRLSPAEARTALIALGEALGAAHAAGVIHLDVKPSNVVLRDGALERATLIDFGNARLIHPPEGDEGNAPETETVGTPGYIAPEHIARLRRLTATADVFALGCVAFRLMTGRRPFEGNTPAAIMSKTLLEEAPRLSDLLPGVPDELDELIARTLSKSPDDRPADAGEVARALVEMRALAEATGAYHPPAPGISSQELRSAAAIVVQFRTPEPSAARVQSISGDDEMDPDLELEVAEDLEEEGEQRWTSGLDPEAAQRLQSVIAPFGARLGSTANGNVVATLAGVGSAPRLADAAARCALAMRAVAPGKPMALAVGMATVADNTPEGEAPEAAAALLPFARGAGAGASMGIALHPTAAALLGAEFELGPRRTDGARVLLGWEKKPPAPHTVLGREVPFLDREAELDAMHAAFESHRAAGASGGAGVLLSGPAGSGKTRVRERFLEQLVARGVKDVWSGAGEPVRAGEPFALLAGPTRAALGLKPGEMLAMRQRRVLARVGKLVPAQDRARVAEFLGEMIGTPFSDVQSTQLRAARADPKLRDERIRRAWLDWFLAEVAARPVVLVLEDAHWGDLASLALLDAALGAASATPWFALVVARPELKRRYPKLAGNKRVSEVVCGELPGEAGVTLLRAVLGAGLSDARAADMVRASAGNASMLEALARAHADGDESSAPAPVRLMALARIEALDPDSRRVLRAASVFGDTFWKGGLRAVLGGTEPGGGLEACLEGLIAQGLLRRAGARRYRETEEYVFRHEVFRRAAYASLTAEDRATAHTVALAWLRGRGETDAAVLSRHQTAQPA